MSKSPLSLEGWNAHDAHEMLGWRHFERGGARNGARALAQAMYDSMYHQPGIGGPDNLSRLHLRAQSQIDHTRTVRLRIVRITAQGGRLVFGPGTFWSLFGGLTEIFHPS